MKGHEAVRQIQNLLSNWNLELDTWGMLDEEQTISTWIEIFRAFARRNQTKTAEELRRELLEFAKRVEEQELR